ncbi:MAG: hypothetical protein K5644_07110 [Lachnospiraceae bacterium]|nr:hypothetical protein [Lachnospiraceae bacterium]
MSKKEMELKHLIQKNNFTFIGVLAIHILAIVCTVMYGLKDGSITRIIIAGGLIVLGVIISFVGKFAFGKTDKGHLVIFIGVLITYFTTMWSNINYPYLYGFTFLVTFVIMLHKSVRICTIGIIVGVVGNGVYTALYFILSDKSQIGQVITQDWMAIIGCVIAFFAVKMLASQDKEMLDNTERQAKEQQEVADKIKETTAEIKDLLENANASVEDLADNIESSTASVSQISDSTKQTAASIETQTAMSSNITDALQEVVDKTKDMAKTSDEAYEIIEEGNRTVQDLMQQSEIVSSINGETAQMTSELQNRVQGIKDVVETILEISSQTNLLSLNASIEAARAGEAGKGFAVVADEIRNLSDTTKDSAEKIGEVIDTLVDNIVAASNNMKKSVEATKEESRLIDVTDEKFRAIDDAVKQISLAVEAIKSKVRDSTSANNEVIDSISNLSASSEEVVASAETSLSITKGCEDSMDNTKEILDRILKLAEAL